MIHPGERIKYEMYDQGLTATEFAKHIGVSHRTLHSIFAKRFKSVSVPTMKAISRGLDVPLDELQEPLNGHERRRLDSIQKKVLIKYLRQINPKQISKTEKEKICRKWANEKSFVFRYIKGSGWSFFEGPFRVSEFFTLNEAYNFVKKEKNK